MALRPYQREALDALTDGWSRGLSRLGIALPTGTGKTHVMAELALRSASTRRPGGVLALVHRDTLVEQTERRFRTHVSGASLTVGVVKAARDVTTADIIVASAHTLRNETRLARMPDPSLIIVDEAHVSMSPTYRRIFDRWPDIRMAGFTATWTRSDKEKLGDVWQEIVFERSIRWAIREGFLVPPIGISVGMPDGLMSDVRVSRSTGDFNIDDLAEAVTVDALRDNVVRGYQHHAAGRPAVLFAPTKSAAEFFRAGLVGAGVPAAGVYDSTSARERKQIFAQFDQRRVAVLTTCTALAEGWDAPLTSCALMVRPTKHAGLYIQQVGRVLRPWPGKTDALVLDFVGNTNSLDLHQVLEMSTGDDESTDDDEFDETELETPWDPDTGETMFVVPKGTKRIDLFAGTGAAWLTTDRGVPFLQAAGQFFFVVQVGDGWNVGVCSDREMRGGRWLLEDATSEDALNYASIVAIDDDPTTASVDASWRRGSRTPTQAQINHCRSLGISIAPDDTKASLSDKISVRKASAVLAPLAMSVSA